MTNDDNFRFEVGVARKDDPRWAEAQSLPLPSQEDLWQEQKIWRVVHDPNWSPPYYRAVQIEIPERDLYQPVGVVYEMARRLHVNVKTTHEGKALMFGKQLIKWELEEAQDE